MAEIGALLIGDPPDVWTGLGFTVDYNDCHVSGIRHQLGGELKGVRGWGLRGVADGIVDVDGLPTTVPVTKAEPTPAHPNSVIAMDHVVVMSPDLPRTI